MSDWSTLSQEELNRYVNEALPEACIRTKEDELLEIMKLLNEAHPSPENDKTWYDFSEFVIQRRLRKKYES